VIILKSSDMLSITGSQIRAARALLRWSAEDLAKAARIGIATVRRAESEDGEPSTTVANLQAIRSALELGGVQFIAGNGGGPGVRTKK
jgi:transcriptional regulator with XRE-family HTH domain